MTILLKRLQAVADMIISNKKLADIGADHAYLSLYVIENNLAPAVVIGELGDGPYQRSRQAVQAGRLAQKISVRQGDGLEVLAEGEVSTVVLAGMGGDTIVEILSRDKQKARSFERYVFQPMSKAGVLRQFLAEHGWPVIEEVLIWENEKYYQVIASEPGQKPYQLSALETELGRDILKCDDEIKRDYLTLYLNKYRRVYAGLHKSNQSELQILADDYRQRIKELEVILDASPD